MLSRICCLLIAPRSPKLVFIGLLAIGAVITVGFLYLADFRQLFHGSVFGPSIETRAAFEHNVPRFRPHNICPSKGLNNSAILFMISAPENVLRRQVIRSTWGHPEVTRPLNLGVVFILGEAKDPSVGRLVDWEAEVYGDIVQTTFMDSYESLSIKTIAGLKWVIEYCHQSNFMIKIDDDVFVNVYALKRFLNDEKDTESSLLCLVWNNMPVIHRKGTKHPTVMDHYNGTVFPTYCSGSAYIMGVPVAKSLYQSSLSVPTFWLEDVYVTGILAQHAGITHKQIGYLYSSKSRNISDLTEGKIIFAHLDDEKLIPEARTWEKVSAYETNKVYRTSATKGNVSMGNVGP